MHSLKFLVNGKSIKLFKEPWEPYVYAKIGEELIRFELEKNMVFLVSGKVDQDVLAVLITIITQYFLPFKKIRRKRPE